MIFEMIKAIFLYTKAWGYWGLFLLMAMESSIFPVPSELVVPPYAYWSELGEFSMLGVIFFSTFGSWFGASVTYFVSRYVGRPIILKWGKYFFIPEKKFLLAESWIKEYSKSGIFFARLLPVLRHLISIPAGIIKMNYWIFSLYTIIGSAIWCTVLTLFGGKVLGKRPELLDNAESMVNVVKDQLFWFVLIVVILLVLWIFVQIYAKKHTHRNTPQ